MSSFEKRLETRFDEAIDKVFGKKAEEVEWSFYLRVALAIYLLVTLMASVYSPDFVSLTIITVGLFSLQNPFYITRRTYRVLTLITLSSFVCTAAWLIYFHSEEADNA